MANGETGAPRQWRSQRRAELMAAAVCTATSAPFLVGLAGPTVDGAAAKSDDCSLPAGMLEMADVPEGSSAFECDVIGRVVDSGEGVAIEIPDPGVATFGVIEYPGSPPVEFGVAVTPSGEISYETARSEPGDPASDGDLDAILRTGPPPECSQDNNNLTGKKQYGAFTWRLGDGPRPMGMTTGEFRDVIIDSINNITRATNDCGRDDHVSATVVHDGSTTVEARRVTDGTIVCPSPDGVSVVDAADLPGEGWEGAALASVCYTDVDVRDGRDDLVEADTRLNTHDYTWTLTPGQTSCKNGQPDDWKKWDFDIEAVLTHEFGHVYGLSHVAESAAPRMTMSEKAPPCDGSQRTLGRGDMLGLEQLY